MTTELLSRLQFFFTASFHFIFPPISMGLGLVLVIFGLIYVRTKDPKWRQLSFFWVKVYGLVFAMGVATGVVQEFEFGTNWANYSRFVGNIFGSLLAAEGIFAFFLEGGFLGLMLFGGNRLGPRMWLLSTFLVAFGAHFSALWIIMANSWMQTPAGYTIAAAPLPVRAVMTSFSEVVFTSSFLPRLFHTWAASWMIGSALILSVSAWYILKKRHVEFAQSAIRVALPVFLVVSVLQATFFGAQHAEQVTVDQPVKLAAMEGLWESKSCAPLYLVGWVDEANQKTVGLSVPCLLSFLAYMNPQATVQGLAEFPPDNWAPVNLTFQVYHLMIDLGGLFVAIGLVAGFYQFVKKKLWTTPWVLWLLVGSVFLAELATLSGWWAAEVGRQPWIVWNLLRTVDAGSPGLPAWQVTASLVMFVIVYAILFVLFIYLLNEKIQHGPEPLAKEEVVPVNALPDTFKDIFRRRSRAS